MVATTSSEEKATKYKEVGADWVVNYREFPAWGEEVKRVVGEGVDQVLEIGEC